MNQLEIRFIGNNPQYIKDMVLNYFLDDVIQVRDGVGYYAVSYTHLDVYKRQMNALSFFFFEILSKFLNCITR